MDARVLASDNVSEQHRARVMIDGAEKPLLVPIVDPATRLEDGIFIEGPNAPEAGDTVTLMFDDGTSMDAFVLEANSLSEQPWARVMIDGAEEPLLVPILDPATTQRILADAKESWFIGDVEADDVPNPDDVKDGALSGLKREWIETVQEIREKGPMQAIKDAALDTVDIVHGTAKSAVDVAKSVASPAVDEIQERGAFGAVIDATGVVKEATVGAVTGATGVVKEATVGVTAATGAVIDATAGAVTGATGAVRDVTVGVVDRAKSTAVYGAASEHATGLFTTIKHEWQGTVQDFNEKGAVGTMKDAALDAAEIVGSTASSAASAARDVVSGPRTQAVLDAVHVPRTQVSARASGAFLSVASVFNGARSSASQLLMAAAKIIELPDDNSNAVTKDSKEMGCKFRGRADDRDQEEAEPGPEPRTNASERALWKSPGADKSKLPERKVSGLTAVISSWRKNELPESSDKDREAALAAAQRVPGRRGLVSMRSRMFEKSKLEAGIESKRSNEEAGTASRAGGEEQLID